MRNEIKVSYPVKATIRLVSELHAACPKCDYLMLGIDIIDGRDPNDVVAVTYCGVCREAYIKEKGLCNAKKDLDDAAETGAGN